MLNSIKINNFKYHKESELVLKPLTVFTGFNSCGKSSAIQTLLTLRQSDNDLHNWPNGLILNGDYVSIGVGFNALYRFADSPFISFDLSYNGGEKCTFKFNAEKCMNEVSILCADDNIINASVWNEAIFSKANFQYVSAKREGGRSEFPKAPITNTQISKTDGDGLYTADFLFRHQGDEVHNYWGNEKIQLIDLVVACEQKISPNIAINVEENPSRTGYIIKYGYKINGGKQIQDLRAVNIGFGVSYTLPVIVALVSAKPGDLIIIENPEAHLHPEGQLELGKLICEVAQYGVQVIVETHSDHIINAIQLESRLFTKSNGASGLSNENVAIHYFTTETEDFASTMESVVVKPDGWTENQPKGFFDTIEKATYQLMD